MSIPTKPGSYYVLGGCRESSRDGPFIVRVFMSTPDNRPSDNGVPDGGPSFLAVHFHDGGGPGDSCFDMTVEEWTKHHHYLTWGERIPDNDRLKPMNELTAADPMDETEGFDECHFCGGARYGDGPDPDVPPYVVHHKPDCPWARAQEPKP